MGGRSRPFCNSSNGGSLNLEDCFELHDSDFALFSGVCTFLLKRRDSDIGRFAKELIKVPVTFLFSD